MVNPLLRAAAFLGRPEVQKALIMVAVELVPMIVRKVVEATPRASGTGEGR